MNFWQRRSWTTEVQACREARPIMAETWGPVRYFVTLTHRSLPVQARFDYHDVDGATRGAERGAMQRLKNYEEWVRVLGPVPPGEFMLDPLTTGVDLAAD